MKHYIPRTASVFISEKGGGENDSKRSSPLEHFYRTGNRRIVLFGDAQCGKTIELEHLATVLGKDADKLVLRFPLSKYQDGLSLVEQIHVPDSFPDDAIPCFLLDGFDEVKEAWKEAVGIELEELSRRFNKGWFLITCRTNTAFGLKLPGFITLSLDKLDSHFILEYIRLYANDSKGLLDLFPKYRYGNLTSSPFLLEEVVEFFNEKGNLPLNKAEIYERFVEKALNINKKGYSNPVAETKERKAWDSFLQELAFCLMTSQQQEASLEELLDVFPSFLESHQDLSACPLIRLGETKNVSFIHNAFREYFTARSLMSLDFRRIVGIVCYPNTDTLIPSWIQPLMLLLPQLKQSRSSVYDELLRWVMDCHINELVWYGGDFIDENTRSRVFKDLYQTERYSWSNTYTERLMLFGNTDASIDLLLSGIRNGNYSLYHYLADADLSFRSTQEVKWLQDNAVKICLAKADEGKNELDDFLELFPFDNNRMKTREVLDPLIELSHRVKSYYLSDAIMDIIIHLDLYDQYASFIFDNAEYIDSLYRGFISFKEPDHVRRALMMLIREDVNFKWKAREDLFDALIERVLSWEDAQIKETADAFMEGFKHWKYLMDILSFSALRRFFRKITDPMSMAEGCLEMLRSILIQRYNDGDNKVDEDDYVTYSTLLALLLNKDIRQRMTKGDSEEVSLNAEIIFDCICSFPYLLESEIQDHPTPIRIDYIQESINALFDKDLMMENIQAILTPIKGKTDKVSSSTIWYMHERCRDYRSAFHYLLDFRHLWDEYSGRYWYLSLLSFPKWMDDEVYSTRFILGYLAKKKIYFLTGAVRLDDSQLAVVTSLVSKTLRDPDKYLDHRNYVLTWDKLLDVIAVFKPDLDDADLALLLPFFAKNLNIEHPYTEKNLFSVADFVLSKTTDFHSLEPAIRASLEAGKMNSEAAESLYKWIVEKRLRSMYSYLLPLMNQIPSYKYKDLMETFPREVYPFETIFSDVDDRSFLSVVTELRFKINDHDASILTDRLLRIAKDSEEKKDRIRAHELLASFGNEESLRWLADNGIASDVVLLDKYDSKYLHTIMELFKASYDDMVGKIQISGNGVPADHALERIAFETEATRDQVVLFLRQQAENYPSFEMRLNQHADKIYKSYFEVHSAKMNLLEAAKSMKAKGIKTRLAI